MASFIIRGGCGASRVPRSTFPMLVVFGKKLHLEIHVHAVEIALRKTQSRNKKAGYNSGTCACTSPGFFSWDVVGTWRNFLSDPNRRNRRGSAQEFFTPAPP